MEKQSDTRKMPSYRKYIITAVVILLLIISSLVFILLTQEQKPDAASERVIRQAAAKQLNKDPNKLTDEDFVKITEFRFAKVFTGFGNYKMKM